MQTAMGGCVWSLLFALGVVRRSIVFQDREYTEAVGFLPADYVEMRRERRWNVVALTLFGLVMGGIAVAFFATDRNWREVRATQQEVHRQFEYAGDQILAMEAYEARVQSMLFKANTAIGLLDTAPKSILLSEIVNRMPEGVSLSRWSFQSAPMHPMRATVLAVRSLRAEPETTNEQFTPRFWTSSMELEGVAKTDQHVSVFINALVELSLLKHVRLEFSRQNELDGVSVREFKITIEGDPMADVRTMNMASVLEETK